MKIFLHLAVFLLITNNFAHAANEAKLEPGICGPARSITSILENAGYQYFFAFSRLHDGKLLLVFLPSAQRLYQLRLQGQVNPSFLGIEKIEVIHEDNTKDPKGGRRCISNISNIPLSELASLKDYFAEIYPLVETK